MVLSCACFSPRHSPNSNYYCRASDIAAVGSTINVFDYYAVWVEHRTHRLPDTDQMHYLLFHVYITGALITLFPSLVLNLRGVSLLGLDSHPSHNKGIDYAPCFCQQKKTSLILAIVHSTQLTI